MIRYTAAYAQPVELLPRWKELGCNLFIGWASRKATGGKDPAVDRAAQLEWRAACRALGVAYIDMPMPDWRTPISAADLAADLSDPFLLGWMGPDEPNLKPDGKTWRISIGDFTKFWAPLMAADPKDTKKRFANFAGNNLTAAWGYYDASDVIPYAQAPTDLSQDWHPKNDQADRYGNDLPGKAIRMLNKVNLQKPKWSFLECSDQQRNPGKGRAPTLADMDEQYDRLIAEGGPLVGIIWFPQAPKPNAGHIFDNTDEDHRAKIKEINQKFLKGADPIVIKQPDPLAAINQSLVGLQSRCDDLVKQLQAANQRADKQAADHAALVESLKKDLVIRVLS